LRTAAFASFAGEAVSKVRAPELGSFKIIDLPLKVGESKVHVVNEELNVVAHLVKWLAFP